MTEKKEYTPPKVRTVECFCNTTDGKHLPVCPVARIGRFRILTPDDFVALYGQVLSAMLIPLGDLQPRSIQIRSDLDVMLAPICPRCYERDGSIVQTSEPRRMCIPCSRDQEP